MQKLEMIPCPKCGNDFPLKRKELGFHVCVNCSSTKPVVAITTVEGSGDHTWNDIIIMDQDKAAAIARKEAEVMPKEQKIDDTGYRILMNTNSDAGQTVYHIHLHLIGGEELKGI